MSKTAEDKPKLYPRFSIKKERCHCGSPKCPGVRQPFVIRRHLNADRPLGAIVFRGATFEEVTEHMGLVLDIKERAQEY